MPSNERFMPVPPTAVWDTLADPASYGFWVVGSKVIRDADPRWPAPGSKFLSPPPVLRLRHVALPARAGRGRGAGPAEAGLPASLTATMPLP